MWELVSDLEHRLDQPTARGLASAVNQAVRDGALPPGTKLPPIRTVAEQLGLSPTTVSAGWALLARAGTIHTDGRRGTTVAQRRPVGSRYRQALNRGTSFALDLSTGVPDPLLLPDLRPALAALQPATVPGSYLDEPMLGELRDVLSADWPYVAERFLIADGAMDALELITRSLVGVGDRVLVEHPVFPPLLDLLDSLGAVAVGVPLDADGPQVVEFGAALARGASLVLLQPRAQNPTGVSLTGTRAAELAALLAEATAVVVEDDSAGAVAAGPAMSLGSWLPERTLHVRSFSKSHGPDLRLAAVSGPADLVDELVLRRQLGQGWSSRMLQRVLFSLLSEPAAQAQVEHARHEYARRRAAVVDGLAAAGIAVGGTDGLNIWVPVLDEQAAVVRLASRGIGVTPGAPFAVGGEPDAHIRVTVGLVADGHAELVTELRDAATARGWSGAR